MNKKKKRVKASDFYDRYTKYSTLTIDEGIEEIDSCCFDSNEHIRCVNFPKTLKAVGFFSFSSCINLAKINFQEGVEKIGDSAFSSCKELVEINLPESLKIIGDFAFSGCTSLKKIRIPRGVTEIDGLFCDCTSLYEVILNEGLENIGLYAFKNCCLKEVTLPSTIKKIHPEAFFCCNSLKRVNVPIKNFFDLELYNNPTFQKNKVVFNIECSLGELNYYRKSNPYIFDELENQGRLIVSARDNKKDARTERSMSSISYFSPASFSISGEIEEIPKSFFNNSKNLEEITIPSTVRIIDAYAFQNCTSLKEVNIGDEVTDIRNNAFDSCVSLTRIDIPKSVKSIGSFCFNKCTSLETVSLQEGIEQLGENSFYGCTSLKNLNIPGSLKWVRTKWYLRSTGLEKVTLGKGITEIEPNGFYLCKNLKTISFPRSLTTIGESAFAGCGCLEKIILPNGVKTIGESAFLDCDRITSIKLPNCYCEIGKDAFTGTKITELDLSIRLKLMDPSILSNVASLDKVKVKYNSLEELLGFIKNNKEALYSFYTHKGSKKIEFIGYEFTNTAKLQLAFMLNPNVYTFVNQEMGTRTTIDEDELVIERYTGDKAIDLLITKIMLQSKSLVPFSKNIVKEKVDDIVKLYDPSSTGFISVYDESMGYQILSMQEVKKRIIESLKVVLSALKEVEKYNEIIRQINYYKGLVDGRYSKAKEDDFISRDIVDILFFLKSFPEKYENNNKKKIAIFLDNFVTFYIEASIFALLTNNQNGENLDVRTDLALMVAKMNKTISNELVVFKKYQSLLVDLTGVKNSYCGIEVLKKQIDSLPDEDFKQNIQNEFNEVIKEKIKLVTSKTEDSERYLESDFDSIKQGILTQLNTISNKINKYNHNKRLELMGNIYALGDYYGVAESSPQRILITENKEINDIITQIYRKTYYLPSSYKEIINNRVMSVLKKYEEARKEFEPDFYSDLKPRLHFGTAETKVNDVINDLIGILDSLNDVDQFKSQLKQVAYYFDLLSGKETKIEGNDDAAKKIVRLLKILVKFPNHYQNSVKEKLKNIIILYGKSINDDIDTIFDDDPMTNPGSVDYRSTLSMQLDRLNGRVSIEFGEFSRFLALQDALKNLDSTSFEDIKSILKMKERIAALENRKLRGKYQKEFAVIIDEIIGKISNIFETSESYSSEKYLSIILEIESKVEVLEARMYEDVQLSILRETKAKVEEIINYTNVGEVKKQLLECLYGITIGFRVDVDEEQNNVKSIKSIILSLYYSVIESDVLDDGIKYYVVRILVNTIGKHLQMIENGECTPSNNYKIAELMEVINDLKLKVDKYVSDKKNTDSAFNSENFAL